MPIPILVPIAIGVGAAILAALSDDAGKPTTPSAGLTGRYVDDGDGLHLRLSGWRPGSTGTAVVHSRTPSGGYLKAAHALFADRDGDFCLAKPLEGETCDFYLPHGASLGLQAQKLQISVRTISASAGGAPVSLLSEDMLTLDAVNKPFSIVHYLRPLLVMSKALAEVDGPLAIEEVRYIREFVTAQFNPSGEELEHLRALLKADTRQTPQEAAAVLRYRLESPNMSGVAALFKGLASADNGPNLREVNLMKELLVLAGMSAPEVDEVVASLGVASLQRIEECLAALGLSGRPSRDELQRAWRRAMKDFHPDKYHGTELPEAVRTMIARRGAEINSAYDTLQKAFGYVTD